MTLRLSKNTVIVFGQELSGYGQGASFDYTEGSLKIESGTLTLPHETTNLTTLRKEFGLADIYNTGIHAQLEFDVILHGDGMVGNDVKEPRMGKLLQACLFQQTTELDGNNNVVAYEYATSDGQVGFQSDFPSLAFEIYLMGNGVDADKYTLVGCVGTFRFTGSVGRFPILSFTFMGKLLGNPTTTSIPAVTYPDIKPFPLEGIDLSFAGQSVCLNEISIELGNKVAVRRCLSDDDGIAGMIITSRETSGSIDPEAVFESDLPIFEKMKNADKLSLSFTIGSEQGNTITFTSDTVKIKDFRFGDRDGLATHELDLAFVQPAGGSELTIKFE